MKLIHTGLISLSILCSVIIAGCSWEQSQTEEIPFVMVTQPQGEHIKLKSYAGDVQARQQTALAFRVGGQITERYVDVGDQVRNGQVLAKLDVKDAQLQLNSTRAQLENARSALKIAQDELARFKTLLPSNAVSRSQYDAVKNQYEAAAATLKQAQANYEVSLNQTKYNTLVANKNGVITAREIEVGQVVAAGQAAFQLAISGEKDVVIGVPEQAVSDIRVGQSAKVILWTQPNEQLNAYVREISPAADQSRTFSVKVALKQGVNLAQLGQSARVFFSEQQDHVLTVPLASVTANQNQPYVWVVKKDHTLRKVPVTLGEYGRTTVTILSGLKPQDYVVMGGVHLLRENQKIKPINSDNKTVNISTGAQ